MPLDPTTISKITLILNSEFKSIENISLQDLNGNRIYTFDFEPDPGFDYGIDPLNQDIIAIQTAYANGIKLSYNIRRTEYAETVEAFLAEEDPSILRPASWMIEANWFYQQTNSEGDASGTSGSLESTQLVLWQRTAVTGPAPAPPANYLWSANGYVGDPENWLLDPAGLTGTGTDWAILSSASNGVNGWQQTTWMLVQASGGLPAEYSASFDGANPHTIFIVGDVVVRFYIGNGTLTPFIPLVPRLLAWEEILSLSFAPANSDIVSTDVVPFIKNDYRDYLFSFTKREWPTFDTLVSWGGQVRVSNHAIKIVSATSYIPEGKTLLLSFGITGSNFALNKLLYYPVGTADVRQIYHCNFVGSGGIVNRINIVKSNPGYEVANLKIYRR